MRINKSAILWTCILSASSLILSIVSHFCSCANNYLENLFIGIFSSSILALLIAIINYRAERKKTLEKFYSYANKAVANFNRFENNGNLERSINSVLQMNQFDYIELDNAYGDISFIFYYKKNRKYIYDKLYKPILDCRNLIAEKSFHFMKYKKATNGNSRAMQRFVDDIADILLIQKEQKMINSYGVSTVIKTTHSKLSSQLHAELTGRYYKIMYPHVKEVKNNAD